MSTYGRNFEFRVQPHQGQRAARYFNAEGDAVPIGAPVVVDTTAGPNEDERLGLEIAPAATARPASGLGGIIVYEWAPSAFAGDDELLTTFSDKDFVPDLEPCWLASGDQVKVVLRNVAPFDFFGQRSYPGRIMVAGVGIATPTVNVGDLLEPHTTPSDTNGYWQTTGTAANAWLTVLHVDNERAEVEARFLF